MAEIKKWVWQHSSYPSFPYDYSKIKDTLFDVTKKSGILEGLSLALEKKDTTNLQIDALSEEIISSSQIEGEILNRDSIRSSLKKRLDASFDYSNDNSTHHSDGLVDILIDSSFNQESLTKERLNGWHNALFPTGYSGLVKIKVASFRDEEISVVSGWGAKEKIHYKAPLPIQLESEIDNFLNYINNSNDNPLIKSAIAHLWFVIIHPFDDGNGRLARAITNYILSKELGLNYKYLSISLAVLKDKKRYYDILEKSNNLFFNRNYDFTEWILWHTNMINKALEFSLDNIKIVIKKAKFWERARELQLNPKQIKVLNKLLNAGENFEGGLTNKKYRAIAKTTQITASRHIKDLLEKGLIKEIDGYGGRSVRYKIVWEYEV